jgi:hypothetical protein
MKNQPNSQTLHLETPNKEQDSSLKANPNSTKGKRKGTPEFTVKEANLNRKERRLS